MTKIRLFIKNIKTSKEYAKGVSLLEVLNDLPIENKEYIVSAQVNNKSRGLDFSLFTPKTIQFVDLTSLSGMRAYMRTISMVMAKAVEDVFPNCKLRIEHPLSKGYFCSLIGDPGLPLEEAVVVIKKRMQVLIDSDLEVVTHEKPKAEVIALFQERGDEDKVKLLKSLNRCYIRFYEIDGYFDFYNGPLMLTTRKIHLFDLNPYDEGMLLHIPSKSDPTKLSEYVEQKKMYKAFQDHIHWGEIMRIKNVGDLNEFIGKENQIGGLMKVAEALQENRIVHIADEIVNRKSDVKFIMISGPSSSGKTTFTKRLSTQLMAAGIRPIMISLDDYFLDRENTPRDENGDYDYEHLQALDIPFFNQQLSELLEGKEVALPTFDFKTGKRVFKGNKIQIKDQSVVLMEGIHALNPDLTPTIPEIAKFKIYVSALTVISLDNHNWIPTTDNRLIRRIVRDNQYRNTTAQATLKQWASVRRGEDRWIFPFQENADAMFNSALIFEIACLRKFIEPLLMEVPQDSEEHAEAHRLLKSLRFFKNVPDDIIAETSLLREFVGGSAYEQ